MGVDRAAFSASALPASAPASSGRLSRSCRAPAPAFSEGSFSEGSSKGNGGKDSCLAAKPLMF